MVQPTAFATRRRDGALRLLRLLRRFARESRGVTHLIFALSLIPIVLAAGASIDMGRAYVVRARLSYALDSAGLAVGSAPTNDVTELQTILEDYFSANYPEERLGVPATPVMTIDGNTINLSATAELPTTLMNVIGIHVLQVSASSTIIKTTKGLEVAMVLDITGSMAGSKIAALITASHAFVDILFGDDETNVKLKIGIVPFNTTVNLGTGMGSYVKDEDAARFSPDTWKGCVEARPGGHDTTDEYVASDAADNGRWRAYAWPPHAIQNNWPPVTATAGPNKGCPDAEVLAMTSSKTPLHDRINELTAVGNTHVNIGAVWGWRLLSPAEPYTEGVAYGDTEFGKVAIIMTDGENVISTTSGTYSSFGTVAEATAKLDGCTTKACKEAELNERMLEVCTKMKDLGIVVYTVGFDLAGSTALPLLEACATTPAHFFNSPSNADLVAAFTAIGNALVNLRIGQ
ncbi:MAG: pilus assembly protein [Alphaproteobacteria bacterium]